MHLNIRQDSQKNTGRSFIEEARRSQIIEATIDVLAKYGYVNTTFARIAAHASISPSLISYHFTNKEELTLEVYRSINSTRVANMVKSIEGHSSAVKMLHALLETDLTYMGTRPELFKALVEALFSIRDSEGFPQLMGEDKQPAVSMVEQILRTGQKNGEFRSFDTYATALIIDGACDQFLAQLPNQPKYNLAVFTKTLIELVDSYVLRSVNNE